MEDIATSAHRYMMLFQRDADARIDADLSRAIGRTDWDEFTRLQRVKLRIRRVEMQADAKAHIGRLMQVAGMTAPHRERVEADSRKSVAWGF